MDDLNDLSSNDKLLTYNKRPINSLRHGFLRFSKMLIGYVIMCMRKIPLERMRITNHSGKVIINYGNNGLGDILIRERSGHRSNALNGFKMARMCCPLRCNHRSL